MRLHARTDDFETTVSKARQFMDAQEQAKLSTVGKKPNVRFAANDSESNQIQPILDGLQKGLQTVLENQNSIVEVKTGIIKFWTEKERHKGSKCCSQ